nr:MAG TPA: hypothetical protein [Bacteriophage sp.]
MGTNGNMQMRILNKYLFSFIVQFMLDFYTS